MPPLDLQSFGPPLAALLVREELNELGPGRPDESLRRPLADLQLDAAFAPHKIVRRDQAEACLAGLWLLHDFLDQSHAISQSLDDSAGSFWHGIMHRREPDYGNAKYWFQRVGRHPVFAPLATAARQLAEDFLAEHPSDRTAKSLAEQGDWDPFLFVDACQSVARQPNTATAMLCRQIQRQEWELLFDWCYCAAIGK